MTSDRLPEPLDRVHEAVMNEATKLAAARSQLREPFLRLGPVDALASTSRAIELLSDGRSLLTAYFHAIAHPRPNLGTIAVAQNVSLSTLRHRYTPAQVEATKLLLAESPKFDEILAPFPSFCDHHLLRAAVDAGSANTWEKRQTIRAIYFEFADRMESPERSYENRDLRRLCFQFGMSYESAHRLVEASHEAGLLSQMEALELTPRDRLPNEHPGRSRRLISEYPRGMMLEALKEHSSSLQAFYIEQSAVRH